MNPPDPGQQPHAKPPGQAQAMAWLADVFNSKQARKLEVFALVACSRHGIPSDAMDVLHDTFLKAHKHLADGKFQYEGRKELVNLLRVNIVFRIRNLAKSKRRMQPHDPADLEEMEEMEGFSGSCIDAVPLIDEIVELILKLPPAQQEVKMKQLLRELVPGSGTDFSRRDFEQLKLAAERLRYLRDYMKPPTND